MFEGLTENVLWAFGFVFAFLILATAIVWSLKKVKNKAELKARVKSWWVIMFIFSFSILSNRTIALVFLAFVCFIAFKEYLTLIPTRHADRRVLFWAYIAIPIQFYLLHIRWYDLFTAFIPIYMFLFLPIRMVLIGETKGYLVALSTLHWGLMTTVFCISHMGALLTLPESGNPAGGNAGLIFFVVVLTQLNDVFQFCWGKALGRHKIVPKVSPNKTVEGFLGGVVTTTALSYFVAPYLTPLHGWLAFWMGIILSVGGFFGDVAISALKRDLGVKDSGTLLPGHGGILDRIDSLTFTAPLFFRFIHYFCY